LIDKTDYHEIQWFLEMKPTLDILNNTIIFRNQSDRMTSFRIQETCGMIESTVVLNLEKVDQMHRSTFSESRVTLIFIAHITQ